MNIRLIERKERKFTSGEMPPGGGGIAFFFFFQARHLSSPCVCVWQLCDTIDCCHFDYFSNQTQKQLSINKEKQPVKKMSRFRFGELVNILWIIWHGLSEWTCDELTKNFFLFFFFFFFHLFRQEGQSTGAWPNFIWFFLFLFFLFVEFGWVRPRTASIRF